MPAKYNDDDDEDVRTSRLHALREIAREPARWKLPKNLNIADIDGLPSCVEQFRLQARTSTRTLKSAFSRTFMTNKRLLYINDTLPIDVKISQGRRTLLPDAGESGRFEVLCASPKTRHEMPPPRGESSPLTLPRRFNGWQFRESNKQYLRFLRVNETSDVTSALIFSLASIVKLYLMLEAKLDVHANIVGEQTNLERNILQSNEMMQIENCCDQRTMHVDLIRACVSFFLDLISFQDLIRDPPPKAFGLSSGVHCLAARVGSIRMQQLPVICMHTHGADRAYLWIMVEPLPDGGVRENGSQTSHALRTKIRRAVMAAKSSKLNFRQSTVLRLAITFAIYASIFRQQRSMTNFEYLFNEENHEQ
ncbi:hypothetical protein EAG_10428 [Camponotus floridanus]|uniref:Uncharacterized protein n=1 Tax=Camponotus floridanus TaxID=104421 RepID=E2ADU3_CAMFO|nr:hypothetical protein EAG_10428 [Camponotus floridanus]